MKLVLEATNPILPGKYITLINTTIELCDSKNYRNNFINAIITASVQTSIDEKMNCPVKKNIYRKNDWLFDADKLIPKSLAIPGNVSLYIEYQAKTNSSSKKVFMLSVKLRLEVKK